MGSQYIQNGGKHQAKLHYECDGQSLAIQLHSMVSQYYNNVRVSVTLCILGSSLVVAKWHQ